MKAKPALPLVCPDIRSIPKKESPTVETEGL